MKQIIIMTFIMSLVRPLIAMHANATYSKEQLQLYAAVKDGHLKATQEMLQKKPWLETHICIGKQSIVHCAAMHKIPQLLKLILNRGNNKQFLDEKNEEGETPLQIAQRKHGNKEILDLLHKVVSPKEKNTKSSSQKVMAALEKLHQLEWNAAAVMSSFSEINLFPF